MEKINYTKRQKGYYKVLIKCEKNIVNNINKFIEQLVNLYGTSSPFELCKKLHINIIFIELPESTNGLFVKTKENMKLILIKNTLKIKEIRKVCAHELAHAVLHGNTNAICLEKNEELLQKLDKEADCFAKYLLSYKKDDI